MEGISVATLDDIARGSAVDRDMAAGNALVEIQPGFYLGLTDMPLGGDVPHVSETFPFAALSILLEGHISTDVRGMERLEPNGALVTSHNERRALVSRFHGAARLRNVEVFVTPAWFDAQGNRLREDPAFAEMQASMGKPLRHTRLPLDGRLRDVALSLLAPIGSGAVAALRVEARALDLLAELASSFQRSGERMALSPRDRDRMFALRERIEGDPGSIGSLNQLAASHGVSASKLKRDFFLAFATCAGGFINEQRLSRARQLIEEGMSVSQAAYAVGYAHPTNFSTAFKRRYGIAPSALRN